MIQEFAKFAKTIHIIYSTTTPWFLRKIHSADGFVTSEII